MATDIRSRKRCRRSPRPSSPPTPSAAGSTTSATKPLPSRDAIVDILADLCDVLYPGFGRRQNLHIGNVEYHVGDLIDGLHDKLTQQIARALRHEHAARRRRTSTSRRWPSRRRSNCSRRLPDLRDVLEQDVAGRLRRATRRPRATTRSSSATPAWKRSRSTASPTNCCCSGVPLIPRMMTEYAHAKTGIDIHPGATIGPGLLHRPRHRRRHRRDLRHRQEREALPGRDARGAVVRQATPTAELIRGMKRHPTLEDDVVVYANATILGGDTVIGHAR